MKYNSTLISAAIIIIGMNSCARFKVEKLSATELFNIPIDNKVEHLSYPEQKGLYYEIPGRVAIVDDWLVISEPSNKSIKIFKDNKLEVLIASDDVKKTVADAAKTEKDKKDDFKRVYNTNLDVPGALAAGSEDDFYVINYIAAADSDLKEGANAGGYYKILHFDIKGNFLHLIGRQAKMDIPFESILWMDTDDDNNLWVLYKYVDSITLDKYTEGNLAQSISQKDCESTIFATQNPDKEIVRQCEEMYPFYNDDKILMIGREDRIPDKKEDTDMVYNFQRRVFKTKNLKNSKVASVFENLSDPEDYPYIPYSSNLLIWKTPRAERFKLAVYDTDGDLVKYLQIDLPGRRNNWRATYATLSGKFYSLRVQGKSLHVVQWK